MKAYPILSGSKQKTELSLIYSKEEFKACHANHHLSKDGIRLSVCFVALFIHQTVGCILLWTNLLPRSLLSWLDSVRLSMFQLQHPGKELDRCRGTAVLSRLS
ncbi:hypothetical protein PFLUV_G00150190 [Perca fluviatilis]|uniref:Uncharacterized protein n=1 Tax=Perca fluviatilis TaxID=8168 RepID=A0A6A5EXQ1_PERFL|nr:hypothetical protein PFLUV_G00150190 [Perca fluviatilis]